MLGEEFRSARLQLALSQQAVADAAHVDRAIYSLIEHAKVERLSILNAARLAGVLGLDLFVGLYPGGSPLRDEVSAALIGRVAREVGPPLRARTEVPLPRIGDRSELRRWDLLVTGNAKRTAFEFESRLHDAQAQLGRINLKRRDDPTDGFVLVVADTAHNRDALRTHPDLFAGLSRLRTATALAHLRAGTHPETGMIFLSAPRPRPKRVDTAPEDSST